MTVAVIIRPVAQLDFFQAQDYYLDISLDLGCRFEDDFEATAISLAEFPRRYRAVYQDVRRVALDSFPYLLYYRLIEDTVWVIALRHCASDPATTTRLLKHR